MTTEEGLFDTSGFAVVAPRTHCKQFMENYYSIIGYLFTLALAITHLYERCQPFTVAAGGGEEIR